MKYTLTQIGACHSDAVDQESLFSQSAFLATGGKDVCVCSPGEITDMHGKKIW